MNIKHLTPGSSLDDAHFVRTQVFQKEQGISSTDDFDGRDEAAEQFVAYDKGQPIGTARYRVLSGKVGKVERVAVLSTQRGNKVGHALMRSIESTARKQGLLKLELDSQLSAAGFYENLGYQKEGDVFDEVGIPHVKMVLELG